MKTSKSPDKSELDCRYKNNVVDVKAATNSMERTARTTTEKSRRGNFPFASEHTIKITGFTTRSILHDGLLCDIVR